MSWAQLSETDFLGTSPFQNLCCRHIRRFLPQLEFFESGTSEKVFVAEVPANDLKLFLYKDSVLLKSAAGEVSLYARTFAQPEDLVARLIAELSNAM